MQFTKTTLIAILTFAAGSTASIYAREAYESGFEAGLLAARDAFAVADADADADASAFSFDEGDLDVLHARDLYSDDEFFALYPRGQSASSMAKNFGNTIDHRVIRGGGNAAKKAYDNDSTEQRAKFKARLQQPTAYQRLQESQKKKSGSSSRH